ncbi:MAG: hypothetical protein GC171_16965 [Terrimonas sp.]|nr:hypothetical protein [Terrimonas sp.]
MDFDVISLMISIIALLISAFTFVLWTKERNRPVKETPAGESTKPLQLQAYERLVMLTERISIPNLVSRANQSGLASAKEMQILLLESIKQEFEYNSSQQIYVSPVAWESVKNLKEQNMLIINQIASSLPAEARAIDLNKALLDFIMGQQKGALHSIVLEALNYEARKLMK